MQHEAEPHSRHAASGVRLHGLALLAALVLAPGGVGAQTSPAVCTPTQTVSAQPDANGIYTTTLTCADTSATAGAADYRHLHYNQGPGTSAHPNSEDRDSGLPNNNENNNVALTVGRGVVFTADGYVDLRELPIDAAIALWRGGAKTVVIEDGAVINLKRTPGSTSAPSGWYTYPDDSLRRLAGIYVDSQTNKGDITVRHHGVININIDVQGPYDANNGAAIWAVVEDLDGSAARADDDILIEVGPTGVIRHVEGTDGFGGIEAVNSAEDGDVTINLAKGSLVDIASAGGAVAVYAAIFPNGLNAGALTGNIDINAAGTIRAAVKRTTPSLGQGVGIWARHHGDGRVRVASSGTVETWQANAIYASSWGTTNPHHDDPATEEIEGHLIDVTGGKVHTRGGTAISASTASEDAAFTVRVAEGALVRAELDAGPDAITQEQLGATGNGYVNLPSVYGWRQIDTNGDDTNDAIEPIINAIAVRRSATRTEGVVDRVLVHGTVETVGGKQDVDPAVWLERGGQVMVGATGRVSADSGLAISSGTSPAEGADPTMSDLDVTVAGMVTGDIRVLDDGALTATVSGTVDGDIRGMGDGDHTVAVQRGGTVTGTVHLAGSTVTVGGTVGSIILDNSGMVMVAPTGRVTGVPNGGHGVRVGANGRIENRGTIEGKIGIRAGPGSTVVNFGTVRSTDEAAGVAIDFPEAGTNTLTLKQGTIIDGKIRGLAGDDTVDLSDLEVNEVGTLTFVDETGTPVTPASIMRPMRGTGRLIEVGNSLVAFPTAFALADDVLSDLTGSIHAAVVDSGHVPGTRPTAGHVWATPFGGHETRTGTAGCWRTPPTTSAAACLGRAGAATPCTWAALSAAQRGGWPWTTSRTWTCRRSSAGCTRSRRWETCGWTPGC